MVDVPSVTMLSDTPAVWDPAPRLEDGWWPTGGAVDPANDNGLMNWQAQVLARRDRWLRNLVEGAGVGVDVGPLVANLNTITLGGRYRAAAAATGAPIATGGFVIEHFAGASTAEAMQMATNLAENRSFFRRRTGGAWQAWRELLSGIIGSPAVAANGWCQLAGGMILQWGVGGGATLNNTPVSFPIAFPNNLFAMTVSDLNALGDTAGAHIIGYRLPSVTGFNVTCHLHDGTAPAGGTGFNFMAIGN